MTGITAAASYVPRYRLSGAEIARSFRRDGSNGLRSLAGPDEDALTLAVEAARRLPAGMLDRATSVVFCSTTAPYLVKNNASAAHAALGLDPTVPAYDAGGALRSAVGALMSGAPGTLILAADVTTARPGAPNELTHGDAGVAVLLGDRDSSAIIEYTASHTEEILDHWRHPDSHWISQSEDRFPVSIYLALLQNTLTRADFGGSDYVVLSAASSRLSKAAEKQLAAVGKVSRVDGVGYGGVADLLMNLVEVLGGASTGQSITAVSLADGCDILRIRVADGDGSLRFRPALVEEGVTPAYLDALTWRGLLDREPPRRPEPRVVSAPAALRGASWKFTLKASVCGACGNVSTPPQQVCLRCGSAEQGEPIAMSDRAAVIRTFSIDRLAYTLNPPMVAAVVGFEGGGRLEVELTDTDPDAVAVGAPVRMTFRRRHSSGGVHNYVWKATTDGIA
ncbi:OB-fold domain-containing protein [Mycolicibacterium stellerae]|uniref:OB-fold domain-containing protein n=1 Tax=Mycolicibacterium stellerae TaxID=2358193 RepID=UPI000F0B6766|nr:OB-fold domain-containing protein [Mycolicibacterium stellerae]